MKKLLLILLLFLTLHQFANAQKRWELDLKSSVIVNSSSPVYTGKTIYIDYVLHNLGSYAGVGNPYNSDSFPGGQYTFNVAIRTVDDFPPSGGADFQETVTFGGAPFNGYTSTISKGISVDSRFSTHDNNIVIIWPNDAKNTITKDSLDTSADKAVQLHLKVSDAKAGIDGLSGSENFSIYPNPAIDMMNIEMAKAGKGVIKLSDISGKVILNKEFETEAGGHVSIGPNDGLDIPRGIYLLSVETATYKEVSKIVIGK